MHVTIIHFYKQVCCIHFTHVSHEGLEITYFLNQLLTMSDGILHNHTAFLPTTVLVVPQERLLVFVFSLFSMA